MAYDRYNKYIGILMKVNKLTDRCIIFSGAIHLVICNKDLPDPKPMIRNKSRISLSIQAS